MRIKKLVFKINCNNKLLHFYKYILFSIYVILMLAVTAFHTVYAEKIVPNVTVNGVNIGGLNAEDAVNKLQSELQVPEKILVKVDSDYEKEFVAEEVGFRYLYLQTIKKAFSVGREVSVTGVKQRLLSFFQKSKVDPDFLYDTESFEKTVSSMVSEFTKPMKDASFSFDEEGLAIVPGETGTIFDENYLKNVLLQRLKTGVDSTVEIELVQVQPNLKVADLDLVKQDMERALKNIYLLKYETHSFELTSADIIKILIPSKSNDGKVVLVVNNPALLNKLEGISGELDKNPHGQILEVKDGKAVRFVFSQDGLKLKIKESAELISKALLDGTNTLYENPIEIPLALQVTSAPENKNEFGIEDLLGVGRSKFKGSSKSRIHNIELASRRVSGTLVPPGEIFSFNEAIGPINRKTGYTSAWIISKGRTVLGDGGGVCQVSTTVFRAALDAGLPIVERNAHAYRVSYYEQESPVGIDATIYRPSVDLKFRNDTSQYILITSEIDKDNYTLVFKIYGKDDGREVEMTEPKITAQWAPPEPAYIEDASLPKGVKKQVEYPIWGASAWFTRTVRKDGKTIFKDTFKSNYRAWRAVYKIGTAE